MTLNIAAAAVENNHNGTVFQLADPNHTFVVDFQGKPTLTGDVVRIDINSAQTGKAIAEYDESGALLYSVDKAGNVLAAGTIIATGGGSPGKLAVVAASVDGAIAVPTVDTNVFITKGTAAALTLADPPNTAGQNGVALNIISTTAAAHTVDNSAGSGMNAGGASKDIGTYAAAIGNQLRLVAYGGKWIVNANIGVTLA